MARSSKTNPILQRFPSRITRRQRAEVMGQKGCVVWLTGLSGAGKSTIAYSLEEQLVKADHPAFVLDGDNLRHGLCKDLGFSPRDRAENIRRVAEVANVFADAGMVAIVAFISPIRSDRDRARELIGAQRFFEVYLEVPLEVAEERDPKGLYKKARAGEIEAFTGITAPYEPPTAPDLQLRTDQIELDECVTKLRGMLEGRKMLEP